MNTFYKLEKYYYDIKLNQPSILSFSQKKITQMNEFDFMSFTLEQLIANSVHRFFK